MRECSEHEITIEKLLNVVHSYTDPIRIQVIIGDAWLTCEEARCHYKDVREGYLAEKADLKRAKERVRRKKKRERTEREGE